ncbi:hypothetical protein EC991_008499 [Linnemannia zychae]|nr:hypothetical protein EC991_008499 [Linnemannia zychae]
MASHSGPGPSSTSGNEVKVSSTSDDPFVQAGARPVSMSSTITGSEKSTATEAGVTGLGMTLIDIPEAHEPEDPPEVNYFQGENDEFERDPDAEFAEATTTATELILNKSGEQNAAAATPAGKNPWIARAASRSSRT